MADIALAYRDAAEAIPFGPAVGANIAESELFHLAPLVCLKRRGIKRSAAKRKTATEAALSTYVANKKAHRAELTDPLMAFALGYVASHYALDLLDEAQSQQVLESVEAHLDEIRVRARTP
jgi:hypothetical protein